MGMPALRSTSPPVPRHLREGQLMEMPTLTLPEPWGAPSLLPILGSLIYLSIYLFKLFIGIY